MQDSHRIQYIDAWRFIAIAMVIICHIVVYSHPWYREHFPALVWRLQNVGTFGVNIFFCISGFVICRGLLQERKRQNKINIKGFYIRRFFRIVPPLLLYISAVGLFAAAGWLSSSTDQLARAALFLCNIKVLGDCGWSLGHTWSLAYEEQFYLFFPFLLVGASLGIQSTKRRIVLATLALLGVALISLQLSNIGLSEYLATFIYMLSGCVFAAYWDEMEVLLQRIWPLFWVLIAVITLSVGSFFAFPDPVKQILNATVMPLAICVVVFGTPVSVPMIRRIFLNKWVCHLGRVSFTIYLWQQLATADYALASPIPALILIGAVFALALVSYQYFEVPLMRLGARFSTGAAPPVPKPYEETSRAG